MTLFKRGLPKKERKKFDRFSEHTVIACQMTKPDWEKLLLGYKPISTYLTMADSETGLTISATYIHVKDKKTDLYRFKHFKCDLIYTLMKAAEELKDDG